MDGIGAFCNGVPPVEVVYHFKVAPSKGVAVSAIAESPWQYMFDAIFEISTAAGLITTAKVCAAPIHPFEDGRTSIVPGAITVDEIESVPIPIAVFPEIFAAPDAALIVHKLGTVQA